MNDVDGSAHVSSWDRLSNDVPSWFACIVSTSCVASLGGSSECTVVDDADCCWASCAPDPGGQQHSPGESNSLASFAECHITLA